MRWGYTQNKHTILSIIDILSESMNEEFSYYLDASMSVVNFPPRIIIYSLRDIVEAR
jgi:hypothetical protein